MESFDISQRDELGKFLSAKVQEKARLGAYSAALRLLAHIKAVVIPATPTEVPGAHEPVDRGLYKSAWEITRTAEGADVYNPLPHAPIIEWGARNTNIKIGARMIDELSQWVLRKGLISSERMSELKTASKGGGMFSFLPVAVEARNIAFAIAQSMKKRGIFNEGQGLRVMERAMKKAPDFIREEIARALANG